MGKLSRRAEKAGVEEVYIATDPDREGEFIAWRLTQILSNFSQVYRITFNEITKGAVISAISNPRNLDMSLVEAILYADYGSSRRFQVFQILPVVEITFNGSGSDAYARLYSR